MTNLLWKSLLAAPAAIGAALAVSGAAFAAETVPVESVVGIDALSQEPVQLAQITSVTQLSDVLPSDWAYQALQSLVEQYGCIQGYPDRTYRGNASLTRYEFAAGLNACLDVIAQLVSTGVPAEDLDTIRRLQEEFQAELNTLRGRVDALEADVAELEANQFSTTTKLRGQVDFHLGVPFDTFTGETSTSFVSRSRLNFDTSFTGEDRLRIRLQASSGNAPLSRIGGYNNASGLGGEGTLDLRVDDFLYSFPVGNRLDITLAANGLSPDDILREIIPFGNGVAEASGANYLDAAGTFGGTGVGVSFAFTDSLILDAFYTANSGAAANPAIGLFAASNQAYGAQLSFIPEGFLSLAASYVHGDNSAAYFGGAAGATDTFGGQVNLNFGGFNVGGSAGFVDFNGGDDFVWNAGVAFDDLFVDGAQFGVYTGQYLQLAGLSDNPFFVEGFLNIPFSPYLTITPAVVYADYNTASAGDDESGIYGVIRTTFRF